MKKAKKLLSVFLAALMVMTTLGGVMTASAATNEAATAAAAAFNKKAAATDHSAVYENMSAKSAKQTKDALNGLLAPILKAVKVQEKLYTDATVTAIFKLLNQDVMAINAGTAASNISADYPEAKAYMSTVKSDGKTWIDFDASKMVWGVTPGDREAFVKAVNGSSGNLNTTLGFVLALLAPNLYEPLASLLEAFHVGNMPASALELYQGGSLFYLADILTKAIDALVADPFGYLGDVLPDLAYTYGEVGSGLKALLDMLASSGLDLGVDLPEDFSGIVSMVGGLIGFDFPAFDVDYLATMGTANAVESGLPGGYRMAINGDQTMVFAALMNYVGKTLKIPANQVALSKLIGDQIGMGYGDEIGAIVVAAQGGNALSIADASVALCESIAENLGIKSNNEGIGGFFAKVMAFFNRIARAIVDLFKTFGGKVAA